MINIPVLSALNEFLHSATSLLILSVQTKMATSEFGNGYKCIWLIESEGTNSGEDKSRAATKDYFD